MAACCKPSYLLVVAVVFIGILMALLSDEQLDVTQLSVKLGDPEYHKVNECCAAMPN